MITFLFYLMALGAVLFGFGVIVSRSPVRSVLSLLGTFFCLAVIYLLAGFQVLAAAQILVYAGAIMVLFLFVIMLLNLGDEEVIAKERIFHSGPRTLIGVGIASCIGLLALVAALGTDLPALAAGLSDQKHGIDSVLGLATHMFTRYSLPFEAMSVLLLATAVGVMVLAKRNRPGLTQPAATRAPDEGSAQ